MIVIGEDLESEGTIRQFDVRDLAVLLDHGIEVEKATEICRDLLEKRRDISKFDLMKLIQRLGQDIDKS
jgi:hypothetical protein